MLMFCISLGALAYTSPGINGMAVLGATLIACGLICIAVYMLNVEIHALSEP